MTRDAGQTLNVLPYKQIPLGLSLRRNAVHMPANSMSTMRQTSCTAHTECEMNGCLIAGRVRMTQNCHKKLLLPCVKVGQREWTWPLAWYGRNNMQTALNLAHAIGDPDHTEYYFPLNRNKFQYSTIKQHTAAQFPTLAQSHFTTRTLHHF